MNICIIAEKPSVARDIARIVGANSKQDGYMEGCGYVVTWAMGQRTACIDAHKPIGFAPCLGGMIEIVVTVSRFEIGKSFTDSLVCE